MSLLASSIFAELGNVAEGARPWLSTSALVGLFALCVKLYLDNKRLNVDRMKLDMDGDGVLRDHYAKEVASLRQQMLESQRLASAQLQEALQLGDARLASAEKRYTEATENADRRHKSCEQECDRLREKVYGLERQILQLNKTSLKLFEPRADLPEEQKERMRSMEQPPVSLTGGIIRGEGNEE